MVLTFESVDKILKYDHSNERSSGVLPCDAACFALSVKTGLYFGIVSSISDFGRT